MSLVETFRATPPRRQILMAAGAAAAIGLTLIVSYFVFLRPSYGVLFTNLRTSDAATIVADLDKKKVPYRLQNDGATILVPSNVRDSTRLSIASEDLPIKGTVGFELFNKSDMGLTEFAQKINYQRALQGELARTIMTMDTVDTARVHLSLADPTIFRDDKQPSKASVTVVARAGRSVADGTVRGIQRLVAAAVPDLAVGDVVVLDEQGRIVSGDAPADAPSSPQGQEKLAIEQYYAARIRAGLSRVYPGGAEVAVSAVVDPKQLQDGQAPIGGATPARRDFPLNVSIAFPTMPAEQLQADVKSAAGLAFGFDPSRGDVLTLSTSAPTPTPEGGAPTRATAMIPSPVASTISAIGSGLSPKGFWQVHLAPVLLVLLGAAFYLWRRRTAQRGLSARQRSAYVQRLQSLLDEGEPHAVRRV